MMQDNLLLNVFNSSLLSDEEKESAVPLSCDDDDDEASSDGAAMRNHGLYMLRRLMQIKRAQQNRKRLEVLLKFFFRWSHQFPLTVQCIELTKQLRERVHIVDDIRSAYLRDVISVKIHLDSINAVAMSNNAPSVDAINASDNDDHDHQQLSAKVQDSLSDLHTIPSIDIRKLIEKATESIHQTSIQLRESLIDNGLMDPETLQTLNPWDQSRGYRRIMRKTVNHAYKPPVTNGGSFQIAAPSQHKLFVRYCSECIGLIAVVKSWNSEVEDSLQFKADNIDITRVLDEFRNLINRLNATIEQQEVKIVRLEERNKELTKSQRWFARWSDDQADQHEAQHLEELREKLERCQDIIDMSKMDFESLQLNQFTREEEQQQALLIKEKMSRQKLRATEQLLDMSSKEKLKAMKELQVYQKEITDLTNEVSSLKAIIDKRTQEYSIMESRMETMMDLNKNLQGAIDAKERSYALLKEEMIAKLAALTSELSNANVSAATSDQRIDEIRESLREQKSLFVLKTKENMELQRRIAFLESMIPADKQQPQRNPHRQYERLKRRRGRHAFRHAVYAVIYLLRMRRALVNKDYRGIGRLGYEFLISGYEKRGRITDYIFSPTMDPSQIETLCMMREDQLMMQMRLHDYMRRLKRVDYDKKVLETDYTELERKLEDAMITTRELRREMEATKKSEIVARKRIKEFMQNEHLKQLRKDKVLIQIQRNISNHLAQSIFNVRAIVSSLNIQANMLALRKASNRLTMRMKSQQSLPSDGGADATGKGKGSFLRKSALLVKWIKSNQRSASLTPKLFPFKLLPMNEVVSGESSVDVDFIAYREYTRLNQMNSRAISDVIRSDLTTLEGIRTNTLKDIRLIEDYVYSLKSRFNEQQARIQTLEDRIRSNVDIELLRANEKKNYWQKSSERVVDIKSNLSHLLVDQVVDADQTGTPVVDIGNRQYFSRLISAIEDVKKEYDSKYKSRRQRLAAGLEVEDDDEEQEPSFVVEIALKNNELIFELSKSSCSVNSSFIIAPTPATREMIAATVGDSNPPLIAPVDSMSATSLVESTSVFPEASREINIGEKSFFSEQEDLSMSSILALENELFLEELNRHQAEAEALMKKEDNFVNLIRLKDEELSMTNLKILSLTKQLENHEVEGIKLKYELQEQITKSEELLKENDLLREIVEEDYRYHTANLNKALREREERYAMMKLGKFAEKSTQVSCSVCAIREDFQHGASKSNEALNDYDDETVAELNNIMTEALHGGIVLVARPRQINLLSSNSIAPSKHQDGASNLHDVVSRPISGKSSTWASAEVITIPTGPMSTDQSKFSKLKQIPQGRGFNRKHFSLGSMPPPADIFSNVHVNIMANTAAFLQHRMMEDATGIPSSGANNMPLHNVVTNNKVNLRTNGSGGTQSETRARPFSANILNRKNDKDIQLYLSAAAAIDSLKRESSVPHSAIADRIKDKLHL